MFPDPREVLNCRGLLAVNVLLFFRLFTDEWSTRLTMLNISRGKTSDFCDGMTRHHFLRIGGLGMAGLSVIDRGSVVFVA